jgi:hypothetical protein
LPSFSFAFLPILCTPKSLNQIKILSNNLPSLPRPLVEKAKYEGQNSGGVGVGKMGGEGRSSGSGFIHLATLLDINFAIDAKKGALCSTERTV